MFRSLGVSLLIGAAWAASAFEAGAAEPRYTAVFNDGSRVDGSELHGWAYPGEKPKLDGTDLFDENRPLRWLRDRTLGDEPSEIEAGGFVEFSCGDRLPGRVLGYVNPAAESAEKNDPKTKTQTANNGDGHSTPPPNAKGDASRPSGPPHLLVAIETSTSLPSYIEAAAQVRILPRFVRRIVWGKAEARDFKPGTLVFRDGRRLSYQGLRWQPAGIRVLTDAGIRLIPLTDLTEIDMPSSDRWLDYCAELAAMGMPDKSPDEKRPFRLVRIESTVGLVATAAESAIQPAGIGGVWDMWHHKIQPAWSLDPMWVAVATIASRVYFAPHEIPISRWPPVKFVDHPQLGVGWHWQMDRNVEGGLLSSTKLLHGWGLGVHAPCELWLEIPPAAKGFQFHSGLDRLAGSGGCVQVAVCLDRTDAKPFYRSKYLVGSDEVADSGVLEVTPDAAAAGTRYLILKASTADPTRSDSGLPSGADPLDIRATLDFIEPMFILDREKLKFAVEAQRRRAVKP